MIVVREEKGALGTYYDIYQNEDKIQKVFIQRIKQAFNDKEYILLLDSKGRVIRKAFKYINFSYYLNTINSKEVTANALKILFSYSEIIAKNIEDFNKNDIQNIRNRK